MRFYELAYLISCNEENPDKIYQEIKQFIQKEGGEIDKTNSLNEVDLAYPIKKETKAILASLNFYIDVDKLENIKAKMESLSSLNNSKQAKSPILRFLIIRREVPKKTKAIKEETTKEKLLGEKKPQPKLKKVKKVELKEVNQKIEEILKGQNEP